MIQFVVLFVFTLLAGMLLYFYPPNIPVKIKMLLLGLAFLLALGGWFIVEHLSYGLALGAIVGIAFVASYPAEKSMRLVTATSGQTEIIVSFSEEQIVAENLNMTLNGSSNIDSEVQENADFVDELKVIEEKDMKQQVEPDVSFVETIDEANSPKPLTEIELLDMELEENVEEKHEGIAEDDNLLDLSHQLDEITDDEFAFLKETREISEEDVTEIPVDTDIEEEEIIWHRSNLLDEIDEVEMLEDLSHDEQENDAVELVDMEEEALSEIGELLAAEEVHIVEEPIIQEKNLLTPEKNEVNNPDEPENVVEVIDIEEAAGKIDEAENVKKVQVADEFEAEVEELPLDLEEEEMIVRTTSDMDVEVQDMLLASLISYQQQGDHDSYQIMAGTILNQPLSDKDYYLFSKLLLDSYAASNEFTRFGQLLEVMEVRLDQYSVIKEELQKYKDILLVKQ